MENFQKTVRLSLDKIKVKTEKSNEGKSSELQHNRRENLENTLKTKQSPNPRTDIEKEALAFLKKSNASKKVNPRLKLLRAKSASIRRNKQIDIEKYYDIKDKVQRPKTANDIDKQNHSEPRNKHRSRQFNNKDKKDKRIAENRNADAIFEDDGDFSKGDRSQKGRQQNKDKPRGSLSKVSVSSIETPVEKRRLSGQGIIPHRAVPRRIPRLNKVEPKVLWKRAVRKIITQNLHELDNSGKAVGVGDNNLLVFDKSAFVANKNKGITTVEKRILQKPSNERTSDDLTILKRLTARLRSFDKYTPMVRRDLARVLNYLTVGAGRYIIKQGHFGFSFYFIVSGKVEVRIQNTNPDTGEVHEFAVATMGEGKAFGEIALMKNVKRTASILCIENNSEFLVLERDDFEHVLKYSSEKEWNDRIDCLTNHYYFSSFSEEELQNLNEDCKIVEYLPGSLLIGDTDEAQDTLMFIVSGKCLLTRSLKIAKEQFQFGGQKIHLFDNLSAYGKKMIPDDQDESRRGAINRVIATQQQLWTVGEVGPGFYFGVGEDLRNTFVTARSKVEVLEVRRFKFIKNGRWKLIPGMMQTLNEQIPSNETLFKNYLGASHWDQFKQRTIHEVISASRLKHRNSACWEDVPISIKLNSLRCGYLQKSMTFRNYGRLQAHLIKTSTA